MFIVFKLIAHFQMGDEMVSEVMKFALIIVYYVLLLKCILIEN